MKIHRPSFSGWGLAGSCVAIATLAAGSAWGQSAEITMKDSPVTFKSNTNLVPVPVVVRDSAGHAVGNLAIDDFQLFDNGKPQLISKFTMEKLTVQTSAVPHPSVKPAATPGALAEATTDGIPDRFVAYVFDDLHMSPSDLVYTRDAAKRQIDSSTHALERTAIFTTSGQPMQEFTSDKEKLHRALAALGTGSADATKNFLEKGCPPMTNYMGDLIYNKQDQDALNIAALDAMACLDLMPGEVELAVRMANKAARQAVERGDLDTESTLSTLRSVVARMASLPGQRNIVMISPGFLVLDNMRDREMALIERALHSNVVIGGLDARGLSADNGIPDASSSLRVANLMGRDLALKASYRNTEAMMQSDIIASLAEGTGGTFFHNSNDFDEGIARTAAAPEYLYILGFSPLDLKLDGKYHNLKVTLKSPRPPALRGADLQVRKGYYAPRYIADPAEQAKQQIEEAFFSRNEVHDLPAALLTQYFKTDNGDATLSAVAKVDVKLLSFRKQDGRNLDNLTVVTGLFDDDGNFVTGIQKTIEMRLLDDTLQKRVGSGISIKSSFPVHAGRYVVRMVVRDSEGQTMASQSSLVEIP